MAEGTLGKAGGHKNALNQYGIPRLIKNTRIVVPHLEQDAGLIGAAALVVEHGGLYQRKPAISRK